MYTGSHGTSLPGEIPELGVSWASRWKTLRENIAALLSGPWRATSGATSLYLGPRWVSSLHARGSLLGSIVFHAALIVLVLSSSSRAVEPGDSSGEESPHYQLTWYPLRDLPRLSPGHKVGLHKLRGNNRIPRRGADAFHPRQRILSLPDVPTHPRQTLIRPDAPLVAPKILPPLPNVVQWSQTPQPAAPKLNPSHVRQAPVLRQRNAHSTAAPDIHAAENPPASILFADSLPPVERPKLPVTAGNAHPTNARRRNSMADPPPDITASATSNGASQNWIALSADPAAVPPPDAPPEGNLSARFTVSPDGLHSGIPDGAKNGTDDGASGNGEGGLGGVGSKGPAGISISGGGIPSPASGSGTGGGLGGNPGGTITGRLGGLPGHAALHVMPGGLGASNSAVSPSRLIPGSATGSGTPGSNPLLEPAAILRTKQFFTLYVNMPNLTSAMGSWVLNFAELTPDGSPALTSEGLTGPEPLRKVDPKYPPGLISSHVEGEVVLYAIIRKDGSVDSIQLIRGVDPELDRNAMDALSRWKFRPGLRHNEPVELESVVRIPFRTTAPL